MLRDVFVQHPELGWFIASIYLICGAFRLARFNVLSMQPGGSGTPSALMSCLQVNGIIEYMVEQAGSQKIVCRHWWWAGRCSPPP